MGGIASNDRDTLALTRWIEHRDPEAFTELVGRYADMVYATCRRVLGDASEAEDAAQECFEGLARYEGAPPAHLGPWLHGAATNLALKRIRSRVRRRQREKAYAATRPEADAPYWDDVYGYVDEAIAALPADLREPLVAHFLESRTHQAIADAFGIPRGTVTYRINRGVQEVRKALGRRGIAITIPLLSALLSAPADAAPAAVTATLGKLAVSGVRYGVHGAGAATAAKVAAAGGILAMKKAVSVVVVVACAAVLFGGYWAFTRSRGQDVPPPIEGGVYEAIGQRPAPPAPAAAPPAEPNPGDIVAAKDAGPESDPNAFYLDKTALLHGRVVLDDGSPVPGCAVRVEHDPWSESPIRAFTVETTTDDNGEFAFDELPTASDRSEFEGLWLSYHVTAEADNLSAYRRMAFSTLELDQYVELVLHPGAVLAGVVRDQDGLPVAGAEVSRGLAGVPAAAGASAPFDRLYYGTDLRPVRSALDGTFALNRLLPGTYRLRVKADGYVTLTTGAYATDNDSIEIVLYRGGSISGT
ncbi:MAG: sigma-70 family RNA polymerase sigma factor, partial [Candidatus Hydrogenedentes bacterium]|nr:sigma-70 family RNA polymerase sigma factor [Candidatus Hydrogenedentota bacterium]